MTKILMTSVRDDEQTAINEYAKEHNIEIITTPKLIDDAVELTANVDGLVIQQRSKVPADIYEKLHTNGLKQITTRTAGFDMVDSIFTAECRRICINADFSIASENLPL